MIVRGNYFEFRIVAFGINNCYNTASVRRTLLPFASVFEKMTQEAERRRPRVYLNWSHFTKQHYTPPSRALTSKIIVLNFEQRGQKPHV